jgi:GNAT superfamily N-acetyltransferase
MSPRSNLTPAGPVIRRATVADAASCHKVAASTFPLACPPNITRDDIRSYIAEQLSEEAFRRHLHSPRHAVFLAEVAGEAVGYAMVIAPFGDPSGGKRPDRDGALELSKMYVVASYHGGVVAGALMHAVVSFAQANGHPSVWLGVNCHNDRANRFYARHGFDVVGQRDFVVGESVERDLIREKTLED